MNFNSINYLKDTNQQLELLDDVQNQMTTDQSCIYDKMFGENNFFETLDTYQELSQSNRKNSDGQDSALTLVADENAYKIFEENPQQPTMDSKQSNKGSNDFFFSLEDMSGTEGTFKTHSYTIKKPYFSNNTTNANSYTELNESSYSLKEILRDQKKSIPQPKKDKLSVRSKQIKKRKGRKSKNVLERYKHLIDSGKAPELLDPMFPIYSKPKQKKILQMVRNRISAQNSRNRKRSEMDLIKQENQDLLEENIKLKQLVEQLKNEKLISKSQKQQKRKKIQEIPSSFHSNTCKATNDMSSESLLNNNAYNSLFDDQRAYLNQAARSTTTNNYEFEILNKTNGFNFPYPFLVVAIVLALFAFSPVGVKKTVTVEDMKYAVSLYSNRSSTPISKFRECGDLEQKLITKEDLKNKEKIDCPKVKENLYEDFHTNDLLTVVIKKNQDQKKLYEVICEVWYMTQYSNFSS